MEKKGDLMQVSPYVLLALISRRLRCNGHLLALFSSSLNCWGNSSSDQSTAEMCWESP